MSLGLGLLVEGNSLLELLSATRGLHVLDAHMKALLVDAPPNLLVDDHLYSALGDIPNRAGAAMVVAVLDALVDGAVGNNVYVVTNLVDCKVGGHSRETILYKRFLEQIASIAPETFCFTAAHFTFCT